MALRRLDPRLSALLWIGLIYASIPFVRTLREAFAVRWPVEFLGYAVICIVVSAAVLAALHLRRKRPQLVSADLAWLAGATTVTVLWTRRLMGRPEEAVHFLEYGVLGILLYSAFSVRLTDWTVHIAVVLAGTLVGTVDEIIQWLVPGRFWDFRDIVLNGGAVALVQIAIWRLDRRPTIPARSTSVLVLLRLAALQVLVFALCLAATPQRLARLADHIPLPNRLATGAEAICEYGSRHAVDNLTFFKSRLSAEELTRSDADRATEIAAQLRASRNAGQRLRTRVSPVDDPFGYEFRVHLFSRGRNLQRARDQEAGSREHRQSMTAAWRENLILESYFGNTLDQSSYRWRPRKRLRIEAAQDPNVVFMSRAAAHLITRVGEEQLRITLLALFVALVACDILIVTRFQSEPPSA
jgi:hypothetical protein